MSQSKTPDRRSGEDRRKEERRFVPSPFECVTEVVRSVYYWTDLPAQSGETGLFSRNWRSWFGHATVATAITAIGLWLGLHLSFIWCPFGFWVPALFTFAVTLFYFLREFGPKGNYWERKKGHDSQSDSVLDFWVVLPPVVILWQIPLVFAVFSGLFMVAALYLMSRTITYNG